MLLPSSEAGDGQAGRPTDRPDEIYWLEIAAGAEEGEKLEEREREREEQPFCSVHTKEEGGSERRPIYTTIVNNTD